MSFETRVYGLRLRSNTVLPGLIKASDVEPIDIHLDFCAGALSSVPELAGIDWPSQPVIETAYGSHHVYVGTHVEGRFLRLWYGSESRCQSVEFIIHPTGRHVWVFRQFWGSQRRLIDLQDATTLFLGSVLGIVLRLRGVVCLHGSVVEIGSRAIVILGNKGMGKSSMAAAFAKHGYPILSDDIAAITNDGGTYMVHAGYPRLRVWPETLDSLKIKADLTPVLPSFDKRYVDLHNTDENASWRFQSKPLPVGTIYLLTRDSTLDHPVIEPVPAADRLAMLMEQTSVRFLPLADSKRAQEFAQLCRLAIAVPIFRLRSPYGLVHLPAQCEAIKNAVIEFAGVA